MFKITLTLNRPSRTAENADTSIVLFDQTPITYAQDIWNLLWAFDSTSGVAGTVLQHDIPLKDAAHGLYLAAGKIVSELTLPITVEPGYVTAFIDGANWEIHYHIVPDSENAINELGFFRVPSNPN